MTFIELSQPREGLDPSDISRTFTAELEHLIHGHKPRRQVQKQFVKHTAERLRQEMDSERYKAEYLRGVESSSDNLRHYAERLSSYIRALSITPPFETNAEHAMEKAELELSDALVKVRAARAAYTILPREEKI